MAVLCHSTVAAILSFVPVSSIRNDLKGSVNDVTKYFNYKKDRHWLKKYSQIVCKLGMPLKHSGNKYRIDLAPWALITFLDLESGRLLEVGAYLRLGAY